MDGPTLSLLVAAALQPPVSPALSTLQHAPVEHVFNGAVRSFAAAGKDYLILEAPRQEAMFRPGQRPVFVTVPFVLSWGLKGGFSHDASVGIGLTWTPTPHVSASAQARVGTFFFTNRIAVRSVGLDINIPIKRKAVPGEAAVTGEFLVIGAELFDRRATKWAGFMDGPQWYASGRGVAVRVGIRYPVWDR
jgi:hypothetical protein